MHGFLHLTVLEIIIQHIQFQRVSQTPAHGFLMGEAFISGWQRQAFSGLKENVGYLLMNTVLGCIFTNYQAGCGKTILR